MVTRDSPQPIGPIRGGSAYVRYLNTDYFISFAYIKELIKGTDHCNIYRPVFNILKVEDKLDPSLIRTVYTSEPIDFDELLFKSVLDKNDLDQKTEFCKNFFALKIGSIAKWDHESDEIDVTLDVNDKFSFSARIVGVTHIVKEIIKADSRFEYEYDRFCTEKHFNEYISEKYYSKLIK